MTTLSTNCERASPHCVAAEPGEPDLFDAGDPAVARAELDAAVAAHKQAMVGLRDAS